MATLAPASPVTLEFGEVRRFLKQRFPFLMVDRVVELAPGERVVSLKNVTGNEPHFQGHFPDFAIMPGVMLLEVLAQTAGLLGWCGDAQERNSGVQFLGSANISFYRPVVPGDQILSEVCLKRRLGNMEVVSAVSRVADRIAAKGELVLSTQGGAPWAN